MCIVSDFPALSFEDLTGSLRPQYQLSALLADVDAFISKYKALCLSCMMEALRDLVLYDTFKPLATAEKRSPNGLRAECCLLAVVGVAQDQLSIKACLASFLCVSKILHNFIEDRIARCLPGIANVSLNISELCEEREVLTAIVCILNISPTFQTKALYDISPSRLIIHCCLRCPLIIPITAKSNRDHAARMR